MNNIRKIIEERLDNARNDYEQVWTGTALYDILQGQIEAYQDCLNLIPAPRTEEEILNDFEALGYSCCIKQSLLLEIAKVETKDVFGGLHNIPYEIIKTTIISINLAKKTYSVFTIIERDGKQTCKYSDIGMQEHKLLNELFEVIFDDK